MAARLFHASCSAPTTHESELRAATASQGAGSADAGKGARHSTQGVQQHDEVPELGAGSLRSNGRRHGRM